MTRGSGAFVAGLMGLGAGLMYFLDRERGSRRRTHARNQLRHVSHRMQSAGAAGTKWGQKVATMAAFVPALRGPRAMALASAAGVGLMARAAMRARQQPTSSGAVI